MASIRRFMSATAATVGPNPSMKHSVAQNDPHRHIIVASGKEEPVLSETDKLLFEYLGKDSPVIPVGVFVTATILVSGLFSLQNNNKPQQQLFMRMRVGAQGVTVLAMMASLAVQERQKSLGVFKA